MLDTSYLIPQVGAGGSSTSCLDRKASDGRSHGWLCEWAGRRPIVSHAIRQKRMLFAVVDAELEIAIHPLFPRICQTRFSVEFRFLHPLFGYSLTSTAQQRRR